MSEIAKRPSRFRRGLSLVELLVVIGIISILFAIAIPGVQRVRESARNTSCLNRLKSISIAATNYSTTNGHLPAGTLGFSHPFDFSNNWINSNSNYYWKNSQHTSSLVLILPFIETNQLYLGVEPIAVNKVLLLYEFEDRKSGLPYYDWFGEMGGLDCASTTTLPDFRCPADNGINDGRPMAGSQPVFFGHEQTDGFAWIDQSLLPFPIDDYGVSNYLGCSGAHSGGNQPQLEKRVYSGVMSSRNKIQSSQIGDGTSHTAMYGESLGRIVNGNRVRIQSWSVGGLARMRGQIPWMQKSDPLNPRARMLGDSRFCSEIGFGSGHDSSVNFSYADGSIRRINSDVEWTMLYAIAGANDGVFLSD